jgi:DNA-binding NtrC family response regulator
MPPHHILVVDDHDDGRGSVAAFLARRGFGVGAAADGTSAYGVMISGPEPSVVILDLTTPVRSAPELLYLMQRNSRLSEIPVIVLIDHRLMPEFRYKMQVAHVYKPYEPEALLAAIERCIHLRRRDDRSIS